MDNLLTTKVSSMEDLLDNTFKIEQLLANLSTTNITYPTGTTSDNETLLSMKISSMKQIVIDTPTPPSFQINGHTIDIIDTTTSVTNPCLNEIDSTLDGPY